jgi:glycerol-3-phosphate acyltransferase PlsY
MIAGAVVSYFLGNISPATIMGHIYGVDIRKAGSGNPGTTNTLREIGPKAAAIVLLVDILKGVAGSAIGWALSDGGIWMYVCGTATFLGHIFPVIYKFKGGKGIATGFGAILFIDWKIGLCLLLIAGAGAFISQRMSIGSVAAAIGVPVLFGITRGPYFAIWGAFVGFLVIWRHRGNLVRIARHEEPKISFFEKYEKKKKASAAGKPTEAGGPEQAQNDRTEAAEPEEAGSLDSGHTSESEPDLAEQDMSQSSAGETGTARNNRTEADSQGSTGAAEPETAGSPESGDSAEEAEPAEDKLEGKSGKENSSDK